MKCKSAERIVSGQCFVSNGRGRIDVGKFSTTGKSFATRYDNLGIPVAHHTFDENYNLAAVTSGCDARRTVGDAGNDYENNIFIVGSIINDDGKEYPLIIGMDGDLNENETPIKYIGPSPGFLTGILMDDGPDDGEHLICCGAFTENGIPSNCLVIRVPLFSSNGERAAAGHFCDPIETFSYVTKENKPALFREISMDPIGFTVCVGFYLENKYSSVEAFDFIVKYYSGSEKTGPGCYFHEYSISYV